MDDSLPPARSLPPASSLSPASGDPSLESTSFVESTAVLESAAALDSTVGTRQSDETVIRCVQCGLEVLKRLAKDGEYCFECAVHTTCACEDSRQ